MFEYDQEIVENLLKESDDFKRLYAKHSQLKRKVEDVYKNAEPMDDMTLGNLKKEKLFLKDKMALLIENYRQTHHV